MEIQGKVTDGVVVYEGAGILPEGAAVQIVYVAPKQSAAHTSPSGKGGRLELPLVFCDQPSSIDLTGERIAEILDGEDATPGR